MLEEVPNLTTGIMIGFSFIMALWFVYHIFKYHLGKSNLGKILNQFLQKVFLERY